MKLSNLDNKTLQDLDPKASSILNELTEFVNKKNKIDMLETRASHVIQAAIHLIESIEAICDKDDAEYLEKKFYNSIKGRDSSKFARMIRKFKKEDE